MDPIQKIAAHLLSFHEALSLVDQESIAKIVKYLHGVRERTGTVWIIGNGGSAATSSHLANDLRKAVHMAAISLPDLTATVTAYANDDGWQQMYSYALHQFFLRKDDCLIAISCSGRSSNIVEAAMQAGEGRLIVLTGNREPRNLLATLPKSGIVYAQSDDIKVQESIHLVVCHAIVAGLISKPGDSYV